MSRIHEEYSKTGDNDYSIKVGLKESGPVIVAAALIMFRSSLRLYSKKMS